MVQELWIIFINDPEDACFAKNSDEPSQLSKILFRADGQSTTVFIGECMDWIGFNRANSEGIEVSILKFPSPIARMVGVFAVAGATYLAASLAPSPVQAADDCPCFKSASIIKACQALTNRSLV